MTVRKNKIRLLLAIDDLSMGGAERLVVDTANYLSASSKVEVVHVLTFLDSVSELKKELQPNVRYLCIKSDRSNIFSTILRLNKYIKNNEITHLHAHLFKATILSRMALPRNVKYYCSYHNMEYDPNDMFYSKVRVWLDKLSFRKKYVAIYDSYPIQRVVRQSRGIASVEHVLFNFPSEAFTARYKLRRGAELKLYSVGSIKPVKNFDFLIAAFIKLKDMPVYLDLYGEGVSRLGLQKTIEDKKLTNVRLLGRQPIDSDVHARYDMFVMSSISEGLPVALLEAMSTGMPSLLPQHLQVMHDVAGESANYFNIEDIDSFVNLILFLLKHKVALQSMSQSALQNAERYSIHTHMNKLIDIYNA